MWERRWAAEGGQRRAGSGGQSVHASKYKAATLRTPNHTRTLNAQGAEPVEMGLARVGS